MNSFFKNSCLCRYYTKETCPNYLCESTDFSSGLTRKEEKGRKICKAIKRSKPCWEERVEYFFCSKCMWLYTLLSLSAFSYTILHLPAWLNTEYSTGRVSDGEPKPLVIRLKGDLVLCCQIFYLKPELSPLAISLSVSTGSEVLEK